MKIKILLLLSTILCLVNSSEIIAQVSNLQPYTIRYEEKIHPKTFGFENCPLAKKTNRYSSNKGNIQIVYYNDVPDSIKIAIQAATNLWEAKIHNKLPIYIGVQFYSLSQDVAIATDVIYYEYENSSLETFGCPSSLMSQLSNMQMGDKDNPDAYIYFNTDVDWKCNFTNSTSSGYNLTTMAMIGIARSLGFGSSIISVDDAYYYSSFFPSTYDNRLFSGIQYLTELVEGSNEMANFVTSDNVFLAAQANTYKIYAPTQYKSDVSLNYFDEDDTLMSSSLGEGSSILAIDEKTIDVLRTIGWDLPETRIGIKCLDIGTDGIGSSYKSHDFILDTNQTVSDFQWRFFLKNKSENFELVSQGSTSTFSISKINSSDNYYVNINGDIEGKIECDYMIDGVVYSATPFYIALELKPIIYGIENLNLVREGAYNFYLTFTLNYAGADNAFVEIEEEYDSTLRTYRFNEPFIAHVKTGNISSLYYSWVTVEVKNKYGSTYETIEFEPSYDYFQLNNNSSELLERKELYSNINRVQIFTLNGKIVFDGMPEKLTNCRLSSSVYLRKDILENGHVVVSKFVVK